ncbi:MAG: TlpA family protein disulfide reductase [Solirubrobacteraceae bacterium]
MTATPPDPPDHDPEPDDGDDPLGFAPDDRDRDGGTAPEKDDRPSGSGPADRDPDGPVAGADGAAPPDDVDDLLGFAPDERDRHGGSTPPDGEVPVPEGGTAGRRRGGGPRLGTVRSGAGGRYMAIAVVLFLLVSTVTLLMRSNDDGPGSFDVRPGETLPAFAAPLATAPKLDHDDVNIATSDDQGSAGKVAACSVEHPSVVTSCDATRDRPLVVMTFSEGIDDCVRAVDELDRLARAYPAVGTLAVAIGGEHGDTADVVRNRRWTLPVVYDRDTALTARLGAPVCPYALVTRPGGEVAERLVGRDNVARGLERAMRAIAAGDASGQGTRSVPAPPAAGR